MKYEIGGVLRVKNGDKAVDFTLYDTDRKPVTLSEFTGKKILLLFYPGAFTSVCKKEMCAFRDSLANFNDADAKVLGISVDAPFSNKAFKEQNMLTFALLSDYTRDVSRVYCGLYENFAGITGYSAAKRSVFIINRNGNISYSWISEDPGNEPDYSEIKILLENL